MSKRSVCWLAMQMSSCDGTFSAIHEQPKQAYKRLHQQVKQAHSRSDHAAARQSRSASAVEKCDIADRASELVPTQNAFNQSTSTQGKQNENPLLGDKRPHRRCLCVLFRWLCAVQTNPASATAGL